MPDHLTPHPALAGHILGILDDAEEAEFRRHLPGCSACRAEVAELAKLPDLIAVGGTDRDVPDGLRQRTLAAIEPAHDRGRRSRARELAGATLLLLAALGAIALLQTREPGERVVEARLEPTGGGRAEGDASLRRTEDGIAVELELVRLEPERGRSRHYECWYVSATDSAARISAGTFTAGDDGSANVRMVTAADPREFPLIEITLETDGGNPAPGKTVLRSEQG